MAESQQRQETKQIKGQLIGPTFVKPIQDPSNISRGEEEKRAAVLDEADTASE
ncbi:hypothetical protein ACFY2K_10890 [Kitasatospora sp. NPDC001309]|uniref:hypothetical protein n=1 Tax=Kitasatospora sp. NPDC001309 TaxID=3364013 RepID=UPI0036CBBDB8